MELQMEWVSFGRRCIGEWQRGFGILKLTIQSRFESGFSAAVVSQIFVCVSESTSTGKCDSIIFLDWIDDELDIVVSEMLSEFPLVETKILRSFLIETGIKVKKYSLFYFFWERLFGLKNIIFHNFN